jgi:hypothetical protein
MLHSIRIWPEIAIVGIVLLMLLTADWVDHRSHVSDTHSVAAAMPSFAAEALHSFFDFSKLAVD